MGEVDVDYYSVKHSLTEFDKLQQHLKLDKCIKTVVAINNARMKLSLCAYA